MTYYSFNLYDYKNLLSNTLKGVRMMKKILIGIICLSISIVTGCILLDGIGDPDKPIVIDGGDSVKSNYVKKIALVCSLTKVDPKAYDGWNGDCPGTDIDANIFVNFLKQYNIPYIKLENEQCTLKNVAQNWYKCISMLDPKDGLFIFFYSGHGGQIYSATEPDGADETLCLWDGQMLDDNVWYYLNLIPKTCRIFMVTDCCNSGSNYRLPPYNLVREKRKTARGLEPNLLHYGGCNDGESSYGSSMGGVFTAYLKKTFDTNKTYAGWFNDALNYMNKNQQKPTFAETGTSFKNKKIFE